VKDTPVSVKGTPVSVKAPQPTDTPSKPVQSSESTPILTPKQKQEAIDILLADSKIESIPRYFLTEDIICRYCRKPGHVFRHCPETAELCHLCRAEHDPAVCPYGDVCFQCYRRGHQKVNCPDYKNRVPRFCEYCDTKGHSTMDCSRVWRRYIKTKSKETKELNVWCYYCASKDHFGDFCPDRRGYVAPTAFDFNRDDIDDYRKNARKNSSKSYSKKTPPKKYNPKPRYSGGYN
jgi:hypothetical protein